MFHDFREERPFSLTNNCGYFLVDEICINTTCQTISKLKKMFFFKQKQTNRKTRHFNASFPTPTQEADKPELKTSNIFQQPGSHKISHARFVWKGCLLRQRSRGSKSSKLKGAKAFIKGCEGGCQPYNASTSYFHITQPLYKFFTRLQTRIYSIRYFCYTLINGINFFVHVSRKHKYIEDGKKIITMSRRRTMNDAAGCLWARTCGDLAVKIIEPCELRDQIN